MKTAKYFSAKWCGPCKVFKPVMEELSQEGYFIQFIDGDEEMKLANQYGIRSIPTTVIEEEDETQVLREIRRIVGVRTKEQMIKELS